MSYFASISTATHSALDTSTEKDIQKALQNLVKGRSSLSIAHRLSVSRYSVMRPKFDSHDFRILVLKDGQIIEQGHFKELIQISDGAFASMWADQVTSSDDPASIKKKVSGYSLGTADEAGRSYKQAEALSEDVVPTEMVQHPEISDPIIETQVEKAAESVPPHTEGPSAAVLAFQSPGTQTPAEAEPTVTSGPSVTFGTSAHSPPSRTGTPNPENEPKRKRISSQNFQRLARRLSLTTRRQGSTSSIIPGIPGLGKRDSSPRVSADEGSKAESSTARSSTETPDDSKGEDKPKSKKKDKKGKKGPI